MEGSKEDKLGRSHPVHAVTDNISLSGAYFDGIIYQKGSQILKQLAIRIGDSNFFGGLRNYFQTN